MSGNHRVVAWEKRRKEGHDMTANTVYNLDFIVVKQDITLIRSHQGIYAGFFNGIKREKRLYGYDFI